MSKKEVAAKKNTDIAAVDPMFLDDGNLDNNMGKDDIAIPRLSVLQSLSPAVNKRDAEYIQGAEAGMLVDLTQQRLFDGEEGVVVIPVTYRRSYIEWQPDRGGFVADHGIDDELLQTAERNEKGALVLPNGNNLVITAEYVIMIVTEDGIAPAVLSLSSSQLKKSKRWNTMITNFRIDHPNGGKFNPAMFYRAYRIKTVPESNDRGSWFGISISPEMNVIDMEDGKDIYLQARELREQLDSGEIKVAQPVAEGGDEDSDSPM
jgi:hypothetical protein